MSYITTGQRTAQRLVTAPSFTDTCLRLIYAGTDGDYGPSTGQPTYTQGVSVPCSFQSKPVRDAQGQTEVPLTEADLFLAQDAVLDPEDRVVITHLYGEEQVSPQTYNIVSGPVVDGNVMHAVLRLVTDGSNEVED